MYGKKVELSEESTGKNYLQPGIHKVVISGLAIEQLTGNYNGAIAKVTVKDDDGVKCETSIFPYKFSENFKIWGTQETKSAADQEDGYLKELKEIFSRACPGGEAEYDAITAGATSFETMIQAIGSKALRANGGGYIWQIIKADKNNFSKIAMHKGGSTQTFVEGEECRLKFDDAKFGKKEKSANAVEMTTNAADVNSAGEILDKDGNPLF